METKNWKIFILAMHQVEAAVEWKSYSSLT